MPVVLLGQFELRADSIRPGHQQGLAQPFWKPHHSTKAAEASHYLGTVGRLHRGSDPFHEGATRFNVDAGALVVHGSEPMF